jgi:O-antigen/teichoic acid export membrane protein
VVGWRSSAKLVADLVGRLLLFGLLVVAARILPTSEFGAYAYALATGLIAAHLADGGLQVTLLRRLSAPASAVEASDALGGALRARTAAVIVLGTAGALLAAIAGNSPLEAASLAAISISQPIASHGELWLQVTRAAGRLELEAAAGLAGRLLVALLGAVALVAGTGLGGLALAYLAATTVALLVARRTALRFVRPTSRGGWPQLRATYLESLPLAVAGVASLLMFRIDVLLLQWLRGADTVAVYTAAYRPFEATLLVSVAVMATAFPQLVRLSHDAPRFRDLALRAALVLLLLAAGVGIAGWIAGPPLLELAFGAGYAAAGDLLRILILAVPSIYLNALLTQSLIALGRAWWTTAAMVGALAANVVFNLVLIPSLGASGAAIATVIAESALTLLALGGIGWVLLAFRDRAPRST